MSKRRLRIAIVMDPIEGIKPAKDSTLAMMLAAQKRGHELFTWSSDLWLRDGVAWGRVHPVEVRDDNENWATGCRTHRTLANMDDPDAQGSALSIWNASTPPISWNAPRCGRAGGEQTRRPARHE
jgi:hypothetical protein